MKSRRLFVATLWIALYLCPADRLFAERSVTGNFHVPVDGGRMNVEFNAQPTDNSGSGTGLMTFSAPIEIHEDNENEFGEKGSFADFSMKVEFDCVVIDGNRAAMSGLVRSANVVGYTGRRVVLAVEDGGEGNGELDKFTWGAHGSRNVYWVPTDAESSFDDGWSRTWIATDFEREDDPGVLIERNRENDCRSVPLSAYTFIDVPRGSGNLQVRP